MTNEPFLGLNTDEPDFAVTWHPKTHATGLTIKKIVEEESISEGLFHDGGKGFDVGIEG